MPSFQLWHLQSSLARLPLQMGYVGSEQARVPGGQEAFTDRQGRIIMYCNVGLWRERRVTSPSSIQTVSDLQSESVKLFQLRSEHFYTQSRTEHTLSITTKLPRNMYIHSQIVIVCDTVNCFMSVMKIIRTLQDFILEHRHEQSEDFRCVNDLKDYFSSES